MPDKLIAWLKSEVKSPPFSTEARQEVGRLLRDLQQGRSLTMPDSRQMPGIGPRCHELRIWDAKARVYWRVIYRIDRDAVVIAEVFGKKTQETPHQVIETCKKRLKTYDSLVG